MILFGFQWSCNIFFNLLIQMSNQSQLETLSLIWIWNILIRQCIHPCKVNHNIILSTLHFDEIFMQYFEFICKKEKFSKNSWKCFRWFLCQIDEFNVNGFDNCVLVRQSLRNMLGPLFLSVSSAFTAWWRVNPEKCL